MDVSNVAPPHISRLNKFGVRCATASATFTRSYVRKRVAEFFGRTPHTDLNPDEVVALGAAVQADILTSGRRDMLLLDVVPLSLGIETLGGVVDKVLHRNSTVPCRATTRYTTAADNQTAILLNIYQGERELTKDCRFLGTFKLAGIPEENAKAVLDFETSLAKSQMTRVERRDPYARYHRMTIDDLQKLTPHFAWKPYLTALKVPLNIDVNVSEPKFVGEHESIWNLARISYTPEVCEVIGGGLLMHDF